MIHSPNETAHPGPGSDRAPTPVPCADGERHAGVIVAFLFCLLCSSGLLAQNVPSNWVSTKEDARDRIFFDDRVTLYCGCSYTHRSNRSGGDIDLASCDYDATGMTHRARAGRLEWEHVVPVSLMPARDFACWNEELWAEEHGCDEPGRKCCETTDPSAQKMIFDLHNLAPSVGQVNAQRSNDRYGLIAGENLPLTCDVEFAPGMTEPAPSVRGDVARAWLYMYSQHDLDLQPGELGMFLRWSQQDPPEQDELNRNDRVESLQGTRNPYTDAFAP